MIKTLFLFIGIVIGLTLSDFTTVYRTNCDITKFGYTWQTKRTFENSYCRDSNQVVEREHNPYMIYQIVILDVKSLIRNFIENEERK